MLDYRELLRKEEELLIQNVQQGRIQVTDAQDRLDAVTSNLEKQEANLKAIQEQIAKYDRFEAFEQEKVKPVKTAKKTNPEEKEVKE